jgi:hypothetical protein
VFSQYLFPGGNLRFDVSINIEFYLDGSFTRFAGVIQPESNSRHRYDVNLLNDGLPGNSPDDLYTFIELQGKQRLFLNEKSRFCLPGFPVGILFVVRRGIHISVVFYLFVN